MRTRQLTSERPQLRLVVVDGRRIDQPLPSHAPESLMVVTFQGLTEAEQRRALNGFPGGRRFRLAGAQ